MGWVHYRSANGRVPYYPNVAAALDDHSLALFLAVNANSAAGAAGPFTRYVKNGSPLWSEIFPGPRRELLRCIDLVYDQKPEVADTPFKRIQNAAFRDGAWKSVYHFHHPDILEAYTELAYPGKLVLDAIVPGTFWWKGPIEDLKQELVTSLRAAGLLMSYSDFRVYEAIDLVLKEQLRACHCRELQALPDMTDSLKAYLMRRYSNAVPGCTYKLLIYDAFWAAMCRIVCLDILRPSAKSCPKDATRVAIAVNKLLGRLKTAGISDEEHLRAVKHWCDYTSRTPDVDIVLNPPENMLVN